MAGFPFLKKDLRRPCESTAYFLDLEAAALKAELLAASNDASLKMKTQKKGTKGNGKLKCVSVAAGKTP